MAAERERSALQGMLPAFHAARRPDAVALIDARGPVTFGELNSRANRLANLLGMHGLRSGDGVALLCPNTREFFECYLACLRSGLRLVPVSTRLGATDAAYIIANSDARVLIVHRDVWMPGFDPPSSVVCYSIGSARRGAFDYEEALRVAPETPPASPEHGQIMLYTSGTTGRPKGVSRKRGMVHRCSQTGASTDYREGDVNLLCGPAYHGAPLYYDVILPMAAGACVVMMEKFDAEGALAMIERHRVTHAYMAPIMFQRLLRLPEQVRRRYDVSTLRVLNHGGAPTPLAVKYAMIDWFGPILREFYATTEGSAGIAITSAEWLAKPGSVGRIGHPRRAAVMDDDGVPCPPGVAGHVHFRASERDYAPAYYRDAEATAGMFRGEWYCIGDVGYIDADDYLFLTGRSADRIIVGGVNIHPQEIDDVLMSHPSVRAACCIDAPNEEWGEELCAVVVAEAGAGDALARELIELVRNRLSAYKAPRRVDFVDELPMTDTGKLQRAVVRARYWKDRARAI